jgi:hypothetical protein
MVTTPSLELYACERRWGIDLRRCTGFGRRDFSVKRKPTFV